MKIQGVAAPGSKAWKSPAIVCWMPAAMRRKSWPSIVLMLFVFIYMAIFNETTYKQLRRMVGLPYMKGSKQMPAERPSSPEEVATLLDKTSVTGLVVVGYIIPAIVLWLMIFKPF